MRKKNYYKPYGGRKSIWKKAVCLLLAATLLGFAGLEGIIYFGAHDRISGAPQTMIIFGCKVETWGPSILLQDRLDTALDYLEEYPDMTVVVTGGKGDDEHQSEAQAMYDYLTANGVDAENIIMEDRSRNTWQNINYTMERLKEMGYDLTDDVLLVSSGFHLTRIQMLWDRVAGGTDMVSTLAAPVTHKPSAVQMFFREPLALVKSFIMDR